MLLFAYFIRTALQVAAEGGHLEVVEHLLMKGAKFDVPAALIIMVGLRSKQQLRGAPGGGREATSGRSRH